MASDVMNSTAVMMCSSFQAIESKCDYLSNSLKVQKDWDVYLIGHNGEVRTDAFPLILFSPVLRTALSEQLGKPYRITVLLPDFSTRTICHLVEVLKEGSVAALETDLHDLAYLIKELELSAGGGEFTIIETEYQDKINFVSCPSYNDQLLIPDTVPESVSELDNSFEIKEENCEFDCQSNIESDDMSPHDDFNLKCCYCKMEFKTRKFLIRHQKHHFRESVICKICRKEFMNVFEKLNHDCELNSTQNVYKCNICGKSFGENCVMIVHKQQHSSRHNLHCPLCSKVMPTLLELATHVRQHTEEAVDFIVVRRTPAFACRICKIACDSAMKLEQHEKTHGSSSNVRAAGSSYSSLLEDIQQPEVIDCNVDPLPFLEAEMTSIADRDTVDLDEPPILEAEGTLGVELSYKNDIETHNQYLKPDKFKCAYCNKEFKTKGSLIFHQEFHYKETLKCQVCGLKCDTIISKLNHKCCVSSRIKTYSCEVCDKVFGEQCIMLVHRQQHSVDQKLTCPICLRLLRSTLELASHVRQHTEETDIEISSSSRRENSKSFACTVCSNTYTTKAKLLQHEQRHKKKSVLECPICQKLCKTEGGTLIHIQGHFGYTCLKCNTKFAKHPQLYKHKRSCSSDKFTGLKTPLNSDKVLDLNEHKLKKCEVLLEKLPITPTDSKLNKPAMETHKCRSCQMRFDRKNRFLLHKQTHRGKSECQCPYCNKVLSSVCAAERHINVVHCKKDTAPICKEETIKIEDDSCESTYVMDHFLTGSKKDSTSIVMQSPEKSHVCGICKKSFGEKVRLIVHSQTHRGKSECECPYCQKTLSKPDHTMRHIRSLHKLASANDNKDTKIIYKLTCDICERSFKSKMSLLMHKQLHKGKSELECAVCSKRFRERRNLVAHAQTHKGYNCRKCGENFADRMKLLAHQKSNCEAVKCDSDNCKEEIKSVSELPSDIKLSSDVLIQKKSTRSSKLYSCNICDNRFASKAELLQHNQTHKGKSTLACPLCKKLFKSTQIALSHVHEHFRYQCSGCKEKFTARRQLFEHEELECRKDKNVKSTRYHVKSEIAKPVQDTVHSSEENALPSNSFKVQSFLSTFNSKPRTLYKCNICKKEFERKLRLTLHYETHDRVPAIKLFPSINSKISASKRVTLKRSKVYNCEKCNERYHSKSRLLLHQQIHNQKSDLQCPFCNMKFSKRKAAVTHVANAHLSNKKGNVPKPVLRNTVSKPVLKKGLQYICKICKMGFPEKLRLLLHKQSHKGKIENQCPYCYDIFSTVTHTMRHVARHKSSKNIKSAESNTMKLNIMNNHQCDICQLPYISKFRLILHQQIHKGNTELECPLCSKTFCNRNSTLLHMIHSHSNSEKSRTSVKLKLKRKKTGRYICDEPSCGEGFAGKIRLSLHKQTHEGKSECQCLHCDMVLSSVHHAIKHVKLHLIRNDKNEQHVTIEGNNTDKLTDNGHLCDECNLSYTSKARLLQHQQVHRGKSELDCPLCSKKFTEEKNTLLHIQHGHFSMRKKKCSGSFICDEPSCETGFSGKLRLSLHQQTHKGKSECQCPHCDACLSSVWHTIRHVKRLHMKPDEKNNDPATAKADSTSPPANHACDECNASCTSEARLLLHQQTHIGKSEKQCPFCDKKFVLASSASTHVHNAHLRSARIKSSVILERKHHPKTSNKHVKKVLIGEEDKPATKADQSMANEFQCNDCELTFASRPKLLLHGQFHKGKSELECPFCNKEFAQERSAIVHIMTSHFNQSSAQNSSNDKKQFIKDTEQSTIGTNREVVGKEGLLSEVNDTNNSDGQHTLSSNGEKETLVGSQSGNNSYSRLESKYKMNSQKARIICICHVCKMRFSDEAQLLLHKQEHKGKPTADKLPHQRHASNKKKVKPYEQESRLCYICGLTCSSQVELHRHQQIHKTKSMTKSLPGNTDDVPMVNSISDNEETTVHFANPDVTDGDNIHSNIVDDVAPVNSISGDDISSVHSLDTDDIAAVCFTNDDVNTVDSANSNDDVSILYINSEDMDADDVAALHAVNDVATLNSVSAEDMDTAHSTNNDTDDIPTVHFVNADELSSVNGTNVQHVSLSDEMDALVDIFYSNEADESANASEDCIYFDLSDHNYSRTDGHESQEAGQDLQEEGHDSQEEGCDSHEEGCDSQEEGQDSHEEGEVQG